MFAKLSRDSAELVSSFRLDCTKISFPFLKKIYKIFLFFNITKALTLFLTVYEREYTCLCLCIWSVFQFYLGIVILTVRIFNCVYEYLNVWICISVVISVCVCVCVEGGWGVGNLPKRLPWSSVLNLWYAWTCQFVHEIKNTYYLKLSKWCFVDFLDIGYRYANLQWKLSEVRWKRRARITGIEVLNLGP